MTGKDVLRLGFSEGPAIGAVLRACAAKTVDYDTFVKDMGLLLADPESYRSHAVYGCIVDAMGRRSVEYTIKTEQEADSQTTVWGKEGIDQATLDQMRVAARLPIAAGGALMPDGHVGYGLPVGGVLAARNAVVPFCVGVDIACRMRLTVLPMECEGKRNVIDKQMEKFKKIIEDNTCFGVGAKYDQYERKDHPVLDEDWRFSDVTRHVKPMAEEQLGTSGSGNHFCDVGEIEFSEAFKGVPAGTYVAILTHSGSRGPGSKVADFYSKLARDLHPDLPPEFKYLAWLDMDKEGAEYWAAMELMGRFAAANHEIIHRGIQRALKEKPLLEVENHHNFCFREEYGGETLYVHRKGATPAGLGVLGIIPGSMATPGFLVEGLGNEKSFRSASHGAGRAMSRKKAKESTRWSHIKGMLAERRVTIISASLDENPTAYKDISRVMEAQSDLVRIVGKFVPRIVKMAPEGEPAED